MPLFCLQPDSKMTKANFFFSVSVRDKDQTCFGEYGRGEGGGGGGQDITHLMNLQTKFITCTF